MKKISGIDIVEETITVGGKTLNSGTILRSMDKADTIGTGTDFNFIGSMGENVKENMDWSKFVLDINGDDGLTTDTTFVEQNFSEVIVTNNTTLTLKKDSIAD